MSTTHSLALHTSHENLSKDKSSYTHSGNILTQVENIISQTKVFYPLKERYLYLKKHNRIILKNKEAQSYGCLEFSVDGIKNSNLTININKSIIDISATLIHELRHYHDLCILADKTSYTNILSLELKAFGDTYSFFKELNLLQGKEYLSFNKDARSLLKKSYLYSLNNTQINPSNKMDMIELMNTIGYTYEKCNFIVSFSTKQRLLDNAIKSNSNKLNSFYFMQKLKNNK